MLPPVALKRGNWVDGAVEPAEGGDTFAVASAAVSHGTGATVPREAERDRRWPRSETADLVRGVESAAGAAPRWSGLSERERARALRAVLRRVEAELENDSSIARFLGIDADEVDGVFGVWRPGLERRASRSRAKAAPGVAVIAPDWSELLAGSGRSLIEHAAAGRAVVLLADARLPHLSDLWARAWAQKSPVPEALTVLHGADAELWRAALQRDEVTHGQLSGSQERLDEWCGAGTELEDDPDVDLRPLRSSSVCVRRGDDVERRAGEVASAAFGRRVLGGQLPGQVARVFCHAQSFSAFTAALLAAAEREIERAPSLPFVDREGWFDLQAACKLGLDEGATQILGGEANAVPRGGRPRIHPTVFTNVEPNMRLLARGHPAPLLSLVRAESDGVAAEWERACEEGAPA